MSRRMRFLLEIHEVTLVVTEDYVDFIRRLRVQLGVRHSHNIPALAVQADPPTILIDVIIEVYEQDYVGSVRLRLRVDNLYLIGYQMLDGKWYEFDRPPDVDPLITGSEMLGFNCSYVSLARSLPGGQGLSSVTIGLNVLGATIQTLSTSYVAAERAQSLIVLIFMICEAARFSPVLDYISNHREGFRIPTWMIDLVRSWGVLSGALLRADAYPDEPFMLADADVIHLPEDNREIRTLADIVSIIGILLGLCFTKPRGSLRLAAPNNEEPQCFAGLPLLNLFSVAIGSIGGKIFGTITISNGASTRNVYNITKDNSEHIRLYIYPNGPPDAITAYGEISIDVKLRLADDDEARTTNACDSDVMNRVGPDITLVNETVTWDAFNLGSPYDQVQSATLVSATVGYVAIIYEVLRNAVAATVSVTLMGAYEYTSEVYGRIYAFYDDSLQAISILFNRRSGDYASVERGDDIPLLKSVVAVPMGYKPLKIVANLTEYDLIGVDDPIVNQTFDFPIPASLPASSFKDSKETDGNQIRVTVSWSSGY